MTNKEELSKFMVALRKAKDDEDGAKTYGRLNPVCSRCQKNKGICLPMPDGIKCTLCRKRKKACPRIVDFWITYIARHLGRSEEYVQGLYSLHVAGKRPGGASGPSPPQASGSRMSGRAVDSSQATVIILEEDEERSEGNSDFESDEDKAGRENQEEIVVLHTRPKTKPSGQRLINTIPRDAGIVHTDSKTVAKMQRKEIESLKRRAETAEGNFVALVGRVQDFRTSLRSEIHIMPSGVESDGLSRLSSAMETTIDDAGLYLRNIDDALKQSRTNWEIYHGTQADVDRAKERGSREPKNSVRHTRKRSPEVPDGNMRKRRRI